MGGTYLSISFSLLYLGLRCVCWVVCGQNKSGGHTAGVGWAKLHTCTHAHTHTTAVKPAKPKVPALDDMDEEDEEDDKPARYVRVSRRGMIYIHICVCECGVAGSQTHSLTHPPSQPPHQTPGARPRRRRARRRPRRARSGPRTTRRPPSTGRRSRPWRWRSTRTRYAYVYVWLDECVSEDRSAIPSDPHRNPSNHTHTPPLQNRTRTAPCAPATPPPATSGPP